MKKKNTVLQTDKILSEEPIRWHESPERLFEKNNRKTHKKNRKTHKVDYYFEDRFDSHIAFAILKCH